MTRLGVLSQLIPCKQSPEFRRIGLVLRIRAIGRLRGEFSLPSCLCQHLFLTVHMKDEIARRAHARLWTKIEISVAKSFDRPEGDGVHHVEVVTLRCKGLLVH